MNRELNYKSFEEYLIDKTYRVCDDRVQYRFKFDNGYGASVVKSPYSYGGDQELWELAVIEWIITPFEIHHRVVYDTGLADDVIGWLTDAEVRKFLGKIKDLESAYKTSPLMKGVDNNVC